MDLVDNDSFGHVPHELSRVQFIIGTWCLDNLGLFFNCKVLVSVGWINVFDVQIQDLVVGNNTWVGKVVDSCQPFFCHSQGCGEHFREDGHGVGNVDHLFVLDNFGNKTAMDQVIRNRHSNPQNQAVRVLLEHGFHITLGLTVEGSIEVGSILFSKPNAGPFRVFLVVHKDATCCVDGTMNVSLIAQIGKIQGSNHVGPDGFWFVVFTPVDVGTSSNASGIQDMGRFDLV